MSKAAYATIRFLLLSACRHSADSNTFNAELQQLGLPREHALVLGKVLDDNSNELKSHLLSTTLRINEMEDVTCKKSENAIDCVEMELKIKNEIVNGIPQSTTHKINIHKSNIPILVKELKTIKTMMENLDFEAKHTI